MSKRLVKGTDVLVLQADGSFLVHGNGNTQQNAARDTATEYAEGEYDLG